MSDFEDELKHMLNESVDKRVGRPRPAPPFDPDVAPTSTTALRSSRAAARRLPWLLPLAAAACIAAVTVGTVAATGALSADKHLAPATGGPTSTPPQPVAVHLAGASIALPPGWIARDYSRYLPKGAGTVGQPQWCLSPSSTPASTAPNACPVTLARVDPNGPEIDVDDPGGFYGDPPQFCSPGTPDWHEQAATRNFGGRSADWRKWTIDCSGGSVIRLEQYVLASNPGFVLSSSTANDSVHAALGRIAAGSTLPAQTSSLRLMDRGYVRSITHTSTGVRVALDRAVPLSSGTFRGSAVLNSQTDIYQYVIPAAVWAKSDPPALGALYAVYSNGHTMRAAGET